MLIELFLQDIEYWILRAERVGRICAMTPAAYKMIWWWSNVQQVVKVAMVKTLDLIERNQNCCNDLHNTFKQK